MESLHLAGRPILGGTPLIAAGGCRSAPHLIIGGAEDPHEVRLNRTLPIQPVAELREVNKISGYPRIIQLLSVSSNHRYERPVRPKRFPPAIDWTGACRFVSSKQSLDPNQLLAPAIASHAMATSSGPARPTLATEICAISSPQQQCPNYQQDDRPCTNHRLGGSLSKPHAGSQRYHKPTMCSYFIAPIKMVILGVYEIGFTTDQKCLAYLISPNNRTTRRRSDNPFPTWQHLRSPGQMCCIHLRIRSRVS